MVNIRVSRNISPNSAFGRSILRQVAEVTARRLINVAADAEREFDKIVSNEFANDRSPDRRRPGAHLLGSSRCTIIRKGDTFPIELVMRSVAPGVKVNSLESGSRAHKIPGPVVFPVAQRWSSTAPGASRPRPGRFQAANARNAAGSPTVKAPEVNAPALAAHHMMKRALERAVEIHYGAVHAQGG